MHMKLFLIIQICSVSLFMATIFRILIPGGIRFYYQQVRFPRTRFWKVCTRCEFEGLINTKQYWLVRARNQSRSIEAELSEVEDHGKETHRSRDQHAVKTQKREECQR